MNLGQTLRWQICRGPELHLLYIQYASQVTPRLQLCVLNSSLLLIAQCPCASVISALRKTLTFFIYFISDAEKPQKSPLSAAIDHRPAGKTSGSGGD